MKILILEDDPVRWKHFKQALAGHELIITEHTKEAIELLSKNMFEVLFLDHDLGGLQMVASGDGTGYEVAKWLNEHPERIPKEVYLHSLNPAGRANMKQMIPGAVEAPFAWLNIKTS